MAWITPCRASDIEPLLPGYILQSAGQAQPRDLSNRQGSLSLAKAAGGALQHLFPGMKLTWMCGAQPAVSPCGWRPPAPRCCGLAAWAAHARRRPRGSWSAQRRWRVGRGVVRAQHPCSGVSWHAKHHGVVGRRQGTPVSVFYAHLWRPSTPRAAPQRLERRLAYLGGWSIDLQCRQIVCPPGHLLSWELA